MFSRLQYNHYLSLERLCLIELDEYNILQHNHLVKNRPRIECIVRSALKTSVSHDSNCSSARLMGRATNEHLAQLDLGENPSTLSDSITAIPRFDHGFECLVRRA
jgi:hypothetical protein